MNISHSRYFWLSLIMGAIFRGNYCEGKVVSDTLLSAQVDESSLEKLGARKTVLPMDSSVGCIAAQLSNPWAGSACFSRKKKECVLWSEIGLARTGAKKSGTLGETSCMIKEKFNGKY